MATLNELSQKAEQYKQLISDSKRQIEIGVRRLQSASQGFDGALDGVAATVGGVTLMWQNQTVMVEFPPDVPLPINALSLDPRYHDEAAAAFPGLVDAMNLAADSLLVFDHLTRRMALLHAGSDDDR